MTNMAELGLRPATLAALHDAGIYTTYRLLNHSVRELVWHREISPEQVHEIMCRLDRLGIALPPSTMRRAVRPPGVRNLEVFRLRVVEGRTLEEVAEQTGIGTERVRQVLHAYFGLRGVPPAAKTRRRTR